jgi:hypothetical protein
VALNEGAKVIRFGSWSADELVADLPVFDGHVERFLEQFPSASLSKDREPFVRNPIAHAL